MMIVQIANVFQEPVECPAFTISGSTQGNWAASPTGTTITIECSATHSLVGSSTMTCQEDGSWSSYVPQCNKKCPAFTVSGSLQGNWTASPTGTNATIICKHKHVLIGKSAFLTCQEDGNWSHDVVDVECRRPSKFPTGTDRYKKSTNQNSLFKSRDWLSANQGSVFPDSVGSWFPTCRRGLLCNPPTVP
eukprot:sb/3471158/